MMSLVPAWLPATTMRPLVSLATAVEVSTVEAVKPVVTGPAVPKVASRSPAERSQWFWSDSTTAPNARWSGVGRDDEVRRRRFPRRADVPIDMVQFLSGSDCLQRRRDDQRLREKLNWRDVPIGETGGRPCPGLRIRLHSSLSCRTQQPFNDGRPVLPCPESNARETGVRYNIASREDRRANQKEADAKCYKTLEKTIEMSRAIVRRAGACRACGG